MIQRFKLDSFGYEVETDKVARQADGAVWFKQGGTVILATAVSAPSREFPGFLPLTIDYREMFSAAGKIPGGYYKREGRSTDKEILTARLVDRAIRPLFPANFFNQLQVLITVYSVDKNHAPNMVALLAASLALSISKIPFLGPVGVVEAVRLNGSWIFTPSYQESQEADSRLIVAGTQAGICMIEGSTNEIPEAELLDILFKAHEKIKEQVAWQEKIQKEVGKEKDAVSDEHDLAGWAQKADAFLTDDKITGLRVQDKAERRNVVKQLKEGFMTAHADQAVESGVPQRLLDYVFSSRLYYKVNELVCADNKRLDGREFDQVRSIEVETGLLPFAHGSSLFTRGSTQSLVSVTLGGGQDAQRIENIMGEDLDGSFMLHYNFPPYSVGEVRPMRGPGRREVGHGHLAAAAIKPMLPSKEDFPYTLRVVSDILESNGSSSMATVCGSVMGLMDAGVPIKKMVSGVAMGLLKNEAGVFKTLTDITGMEDGFGLMDFKVAGTDKGITAIQMDMKDKSGLKREVFEGALEQARVGRLHILNEMKKCMTEPKKELSALVPKVISLTIKTDKIGAIIGKGGATIRSIIEETGTTIDVEEDGTVRIYGGPEADFERAINWVKTLAGQIEIGAIFAGKVRRMAEFGIFVELVPGLDGLVHVSNIPREEQRTFQQTYKMDQDVRVEVLDYDEVTGRVRLKIIK